MAEVTEGNNKSSPAIPVVSIDRSNNILFLLVGFLLGLVVGYAYTNSLNDRKTVGNNLEVSSKSDKLDKSDKTDKTDKSDKSNNLSPVKGTEALPPDHPNLENAEQEIKAAIEFGNKNQDYDSQLKVGAYLYIQAHIMDEAKPFLLKAHELKPAEVEPLIHLGNLCFDTARQKNDLKVMGEAVQWYEKSLKIKPDDVDILTDTGIAYQYISPPNHKKALEFFDKVLSKNPKNAPALYNKIRSFIALKDLQAAEATLTTFKEATSGNVNENVQQLLRSLEEEINKIKTDKSK